MKSTTYTRSLSHADLLDSGKVEEIWDWSKATSDDHANETCPEHGTNLHTAVHSAVLEDDGLYVTVEVWCFECTPEVGL